MNKDAVLRVERATLQFGDTPLLTDFDLQVDEGGMVCLTGDSGCGKTSLLRAILGFVPLAAGRIRVDGLLLSATTVDEVRRRIAYVPQELFLSAEWVSEMVRLPFDLKANRGAAFSYERLMEAWERLGLEPHLYHHRVSKISGGQRQRILLSMSALLGKRLLLADEPTSALDGENADRVAKFFRHVCSRGTAVLVVSHDARLAAACDRTVCLSDKTLQP